jgi:hypothetical protein
MSDTASEPHRWFHDYLDPGERLAEVLFGLIMVLTITLTAGLTVGHEPGAAREMLIAAIGCNIAWGIIDGGMYIMSALLERGRHARLVIAIKSAPDEASALGPIGRALDGTLVGLSPAHERLRVYHDLRELALKTDPPKVRIHRDDVMGALASCWLVVVATIPAAVPFLLMDDARLALRTSNGLLLGLLFVIGCSWGQYASVNRWLAGLVFLAVGTVLVGVAIAFGG